jgi:hypothetical protein
MANVPVIISRAIITREGASPILPGASEDPALPVNPDGPEGVSTFIALTDTPNDYIGQAGKVVAVNGGDDGLEFVDSYPEAVERASDTVLFDKDYVIGNAGARTGNISYDFTGAKLMAVTRMIHNHSTAPTFPAQTVILSGQYQLSVNNYIYFILTKKSSTEIVELTISQQL